MFRLDKADKVLTFADADQGQLLDEIDTKKEGFRVWRIAQVELM